MIDSSIYRIKTAALTGCKYNKIKLIVQIILFFDGMRVKITGFRKVLEG